MKIPSFFQKGQENSAEPDPGEPTASQPDLEPAVKPEAENEPGKTSAVEPEPVDESSPIEPEAQQNPPEPSPAAAPGVGLPESSSVDQAEPAQPDKPLGPAAVENAPRRRSWLYRVLNFLLGPDTRMGRFMRPVLRWLAAIAGLFALGLLAAYLLLYQPSQQSLDAANAQLSQQKAEIAQLQAEITVLQNSVVAANQANQAAQESLSKAQARNNLLVLIYDVANARTYLAQKDGAKVMAAVDQARTDLNTFQPYLAAARKDLADELNGRLETVRGVLVRDSQQAQVDLDSLYNALLAANQLLFSTP